MAASRLCSGNARANIEVIKCFAMTLPTYLAAGKREGGNNVRTRPARRAQSPPVSGFALTIAATVMRNAACFSWKRLRRPVLVRRNLPASSHVLNCSSPSISAVSAGSMWANSNWWPMRQESRGFSSREWRTTRARPNIYTAILCELAVDRKTIIRYNAK